MRSGTSANLRHARAVRRAAGLRRAAAGLLALWLGALQATAAAEPLAVYTDAWPPYVNPAGEPLGSAARVVRLVLKAMGHEADWTYYDFGFGYLQVARGQAPLAFPYFKTEQRRGEVLFSRPLFAVTSRLYYNRQFQNLQAAPDRLDGYRIGRVAGYSYGERLDRLLDGAQVYADERAAMAALLNHRIDLLPMTAAVAEATLRGHFPDRAELIRPVPGISDRSTLHLIAPDDARGRALIAAFDQTYADLAAHDLVGLEPLRDEQPRVGQDVAELVAAEGFPIIVGHTSLDLERSEFYAIPPGTRALVLDWSQRIREPVLNDRLYRVMVDLSRVVILSGPHVGKELYVKNMHINLL